MNIFFNSITERTLNYLDPGSGSILIQVLLAFLLGAGLIIRTYWNKIKSIFTRDSSDSIDDDQPTDS
jgi:hypothetical protein